MRIFVLWISLLLSHGFSSDTSIRMSTRRVVLATFLVTMPSIMAPVQGAAQTPRVLADPRRTANDLVRLGMREFTNGKVEASIALFDAAETVNPKLATFLWQRGLSFYYAGRYQDAAKQFYNDVAQNPSDTEESIWNFLSVAQLEGIDNARQNMISIQGERRPVMRVVYSMFRSGNTTPVEQIANSETTNAANRFYAALYLGLYAEAQGNSQSAREWILKALVDDASGQGYATSGDYMYSLARVHARERGFRSTLFVDN